MIQKYKRHSHLPVNKSFLWLFLFAVLALLKVWQTVQVDEHFRINANLKSELKEIQRQNDVYLVQIESLKRRERIVKIAVEQIGLVAAEKKNLVIP